MATEYIKREDAITAIRKSPISNTGTYLFCLDAIDDIPAADVVPRELYQRALSDVVTLSVERKKTDTTNCMCCYFCGHPLRWEANFSFTDYGIDDQQGVVSDYSCDNCDTSYQIFKPFKSEESEDN